MLKANIKTDHGYTPASPVIVWLFDLLVSMDAAERRLFLRFVTGSPTLPSNGLRGLRPRLTVVRREAEGDVDGCLPSVMTCANYLKLPSYTSPGSLRSQLFKAIREGQLSFHLS